MLLYFARIYCLSQDILFSSKQKILQETIPSVKNFGKSNSPFFYPKALLAGLILVFFLSYPASSHTENSTPCTIRRQLKFFNKTTNEKYFFETLHNSNEI